MRIKLEIWRQDGPRARDFFESHVAEDAEPQMGLSGPLDRLNDQTIEDGGEPVVLESDCRERVYGVCGSLVNGVPHGPLDVTPVCRQHLRAFPGATRFRLEPWRSAAFLVTRDLVVDRTVFDELIRAGGIVDAAMDTASGADGVAQGYLQVKRALDFAACIGCGACVAACPNGAAAPFAGAEPAYLSLMPQGRTERGRWAQVMTRELDVLLGPCSKFDECLPAYPVGIPIEVATLLNREVLRAGLRGATRDDQGPLHKQGCIREFVPQAMRSYP